MKKRKSRHFTGMQMFTSCISTTLVLMLLGMVVFFVLMAGRLSESVRENLTVTVMLADEVTDADAERYALLVGTELFANHVTLITGEQALQEQVEAMGSDPSEFLGTNPFPASLELQVEAEYANTDSLTSIAQYLKADSRVADVVYQKELVDSLNENLRKVGFVFAVLAGLLLVVSVELINNTVRLSIYSRRFLIHTMKLVGAGWGFIRAPFMKHSFWLGVISAVLADGALGFGAYSLMRYDASMAEFITTDLLLTVGGVVLLCGLCITLLCTYLSVNKYLKLREAELYEV